MEKRYHVNDNDEVKPCDAKKRPCKFGEANHYATIQEAEKILEKKLEKEYGQNKNLGKLKKTKKISSHAKQGSVPDTFSADISNNYAHISIMENHLHNAGGRGNDLELYYYNSPAGRLELKSRIGFKKNMYSEGYKEMLQKIDHPDFSMKIYDDYAKNAQKQIEQNIAEGRKKIHKDFGEADEILLSNTNERADDNELRHALVDESYKWYSNLSAEEQSAIGSLTSNSFLRLQYGMGLRDKKFPPSLVFRDYVDTEKIIIDAINNGEDEEELVVQAYQENADALVKNVISSFKKAPLLDEPMMTYRGTSINEVREILGIHDGEDYDDYDEKFKDRTNTLVEDIVNGKYNGKMSDSNSRLNKIPVSTAVNPNTAKGFGDGEVFLEIKRRTSSSPVNNGAWGSGEYEILSNPLSKYKIVGAKETYHLYGERKGVILQLEEIVD